MDILKKYKRVLAHTIKEYGKMNVHRAENAIISTKMVIDHKNTQYALIEMGWENRVFCYRAVLHFELIGGKIWIQQNNTDVQIADELIEKGVVPQDIVLGFVAPELRAYTGFAVA